ncbi:MAG: MmcQ/YjbR family DNA-binding protein [Oscillospiraceae bacterium]
MNRVDLISYCKSYPDTYIDNPFHDETVLIRHNKNKKLFVFIINHGQEVFVNLKCEPQESDFFRQVYPFVVPAYHMNKQHWNTIKLLQCYDENILFELIDKSYKLTLK